MTDQLPLEINLKHLKCSAIDFLSWLYNELIHADMERYPTKNGWIVINPIPSPLLSTALPSKVFIVVTGQFKNGEGVSLELPWLFRFDVFRFTEKITNVIATCREPAVKHLFDGLVADIKKLQEIQLPPVKDQTDQKILEMVTQDPGLSDGDIGAKLNLSRASVNNRRRTLEKMGYRVR